MPTFLDRMGAAVRATFMVSDADRLEYEELVPVERVTITVVNGEVRYEVEWLG